MSILLACQLAGEAISNVTHAPLPGPVIGLLLLLGGLTLRGRAPASLDDASRGLLKHLGFFFVPAGVGVISQIDLLRHNWLAVSASLLVSVPLGLAVTALLMHRLIGRSEA